MKIFGIVIAILIGLFVAVMILGSNSGYPEVGDAVILPRDNTPVCPSKTAVNQLISLMNQGDSQAAGALGYRVRCTFMKARDRFVLQIKEPFEDYWCIRRQGEPDCLWVSKLSVEKASP